jgi:acetyl esterase/lipase
MFRDEDIAFAARLMQAGIPTELHVHPGAQQGRGGQFVMVVDPLVFGFLRGLGHVEIVRAQVLDEVGDPLDVLLNRHRHVGQHGWALRPGDDEQVREAPGGEAEEGARAVGPLVPQPQPIPAGDVVVPGGA